MKNINSSYLKYLSTADNIDLKNCSLRNNSDEFMNLYNNTDVEKLRLDGNIYLDEEGFTGHSINETLKTCTKLRILSLANLTNLTNVSFLAYLDDLEYLDICGCSRNNKFSHFRR